MADEIEKGWSYSAYRASLRRDGKLFAIVSPDGVNELPKEQADKLVKSLNAIDQLRELVTVPGETKDDFIARVRLVLQDVPA